MMCFTKQRINNLTRREIQNLFSRKTKAKPQAKMPDWDDDQNKPTNDVLNFNRQHRLFSCALPNKVMCFTKQRINNLTRREIQNLFSRKTKAKPQAKMPDWDDDQNKPTNDVLNLNRQHRLFSCALPNKVMCFTKQKPHKPKCLTGKKPSSWEGPVELIL
jgi:hypothetical protein